MSDFSELLDVNSKQAICFFYESLLEEVPTNIPATETLYVASILAHYAQTSRSDPSHMSPSGSLFEILDNFVLIELVDEGTALRDPGILETAGSQTLLLAGFFRDQMKKVHNVRWYDELGKGFFSRASSSVGEKKKAILLRSVAENFPVWTSSCQKLSRNFRERPYLLKLN